jgi:CelD/BcsL family acetyltransferase involved in cellulose biosynthesis
MVRPALRMNFRVVPGAALGARELARWSEIRRGAPSLSNPFFSSRFTGIVAAARTDVSVAVLEQDGQTLGFFPYQRGRLGAGRPVGSLLSDYHGVLAADGVQWDARELLRACGLSTWEFHHLLAAQEPFQRFHRGVDESKQIDLSGGLDAYMEGLEANHGPTLARLRGKTRKLEREHGELRLVRHSGDPADIELLLRWKAEHYRRSGAVDILKQGWVCEVLRAAHAAQGDDFAGILSFLYADERPVAAHLGIRSGAVCHSWFQVYDPEFSSFSPGLTLLLRFAEGAHEDGIELIDLGRGDYRYKLMLMNRGVELAEGSVELPSAVAAVARVRRGTRSLIRRSALAPRLRRLARTLPRPG